MEALLVVFGIFGAYILYIHFTKDKEKKEYKSSVTWETNNEKNGVTLTVDRYVHVIVESLKIARGSKNRETRISRLGVAKDRFLELKKYTLSHENIAFNGLDELEKLIQDVEGELSDIDDESSVSSSQKAPNNQVLNFKSVFSGSFRKKQNKEIFWADEIKDYKNDPDMRLRTAIENLPLPGAFREAAIALRAIIRDKRKNSVEYVNQLNQLYWLAAVNSFSVPYSEILREPGFNIMEIVPKSEIKNLSFSYEDVGYKKLTLLNKTDIKWMTELWGTPSNHSTLHVLYNDIWEKYELKALDEKKKFLAGLKNNY